MGLFDIFKKNSTEEIIHSKPTSDVMIKRKEAVVKILAKKDVEKLTAEVFCCMDSSGSMYDLYNNGYVQTTLERLVPLSLKFDDDGQIPTYAFSTKLYELDDLNINNLDKYVENKMYDKVGGGTYYAQAIDAITEKAKRGEIKFPAFVIFITDGENADPSQTEKALREASKYDIYFQFVGIGDEEFNFLRKLDNLSGREFDNAGFIDIDDLNKLTDEELYESLLDEFVDIYKKGTFKTGVIIKSK